MASWVPELPAAVPRVLAFEGCSGSVLSGAPSGCRGPGGHSGLGETRLAAEGQGSNLPRSVLSERERRKRIAVSCEHLRALLPQFDGRREDMASVLEMAVQFLRLAHALGPREHQVLVPSRGVRQPWQQDVLRLDLLGQVPDSETGAPSTAPHQGPPSCAALGVDENKGPPGTSGTLGRLPALSEPRTPDPSVSRAPRTSLLWSPDVKQPPSPVMSGEAPSWLGPAGPPASPGGEAEEAEPAPWARSRLGSDEEKGTSFLLTSSPDWWLGSLDGRGGTPGWAAARSSLLCSTEPAFLGDPEPSPQEFQDSSLEPWDSALGCPGPAPRDEAESIFPDFLAC